MTYGKNSKQFRFFAGILTFGLILGSAFLLDGVWDDKATVETYAASSIDMEEKTGLQGVSKETSAKKLEKREKLREFSSIEADVNVLDLKLSVSKDENFYIHYIVKGKKTLKKVPITWNVSGKKLILKEDLKPSQVSWSYQDINNINYIEILVPSSAKISRAGIEMGDGDLLVSEICIKAGKIKMNYGDFFCTDSKLSHVSLNGNAGDIVLKKTVVNNSDFVCALGDILANTIKIKGDVLLKCDEGDIMFCDFRTKLEKTNISVSSKTGDINLSGKWKKTLNKTGKKEYGQKVSNTDKSLTLRTVDGDINLW